MAHDISRRDVLKGTAAAAIGLGTLAQTQAAPKRKTEGRLQIGIIGCGGKGWSGMQLAAEHGDIVGLCDIDATNRTKAIMEYPKAAAYDDYREMIAAMKDRLDAVVISTPDHHHGPATALALNAGLHSYTEKPLCRTIYEVRTLAGLARKNKLATQMGNQSTASTAMRKIAALIQRGEFGAVKEIYLWTDRAGGWWKQGVNRPEGKLPPKLVDWFMWLGPRPEREYAEGYHPFSWRGWWDFGTGSLGDMGCHIFNAAHMALDIRDPMAVQAKTSGHNKDSYPEWAIVTYEFGQRKNNPPFTITWHDGGKRPDPKLAPGYEYTGNGVIIVCEKDTIYSPNELNTEFHLVSGRPMPDIQVDESPGHMAEFARACLGGPPARSNFPDYSGPLTETVLLGNLAIWADGPRLEWDAKNMKVKGSSEYDELIHPKFRPGWTV